MKQLLTDHEIHLLTYSANRSPELEEEARKHKVEISYFLPQQDASNSYCQRLLRRSPLGFPRIAGVTDAIDQIWNKYGSFHTIYFATQLMGAALLKKVWPAQLILDLYDVYYPISYKKLEDISRTRPYYWLFLTEAKRVKAYEKRLFRLAHQILVPAQEDVAQVLNITSEAKVAVIPNGVSLPNLDGQTPDSHMILMVAFFEYGPNVEGFLWFYNHVWPLVRRSEPKAKLCLVGGGAKPLEKLTQYDDSVEWVGKVDDLAPYYKRAACAIVPILSGGGTKLKLLEAMAWSVPVVATPMGARGVDHKGTVMVAAQEQDFAQSVVICIKQAAQCQQRALQSREVIADAYTWNQIGYTLRKVLR